MLMKSGMSLSSRIRLRYNIGVFENKFRVGSRFLSNTHANGSILMLLTRSLWFPFTIFSNLKVACDVFGDWVQQYIQEYLMKIIIIVKQREKMNGKKKVKCKWSPTELCKGILTKINICHRFKYINNNIFTSHHVLNSVNYSSVHPLNRPSKQQFFKAKIKIHLFQ